MATEKEEKINVPLDPESKSRLQARADANGRALGREAAQMIKAELGTLQPCKVPA